MMRALDCRRLVLTCLVCSIVLPNQFGLVSYYDKLNYYATGDRKSVALLGSTPRAIRVKTKKRRRVFLGILKRFDDLPTFQTTIRKTYLHEHLQPIKICPITAMHHDCDVVYTFIELGEATPPPSTLDSIDVISLPNDKMKNPLWAMYRYLQKANLLREQSETGDASTDIQFDFVSHTWCTCVLHPDRVWPRELFDGSASRDSVYDVYPRIFSWDSRQNTSMSEGGYRLVSSTLVHDVLNQTAFHRHVPLEKSEGVLAGLVRKIGKQTGVFDSMDHQMTGRHVDSSVAIALLPIQNAASKMMPRAIHLVAHWDVYKETHLMTSYQDPQEIALMAANSQTIQTRCRHGPRMLLGIMSVLDDAKEIKRRQTIRETYLRYYIDTNSTNKRFRICALHELLDTAHPNHTQLLHECQLVYTFVIGGNATGPTERIEYSAAEPITLPSPVSEPDVVMLNIKENMNEGKTQTYFKYGMMLCDEYIYFDYIAKTDTDTLLHVHKFLGFDLNHFPSFPDNGRVYGGWDCVSRSSFAETEGVIYYAGSFFFLSPDMARFITSDACDRQRLDRFAEDWTIGAFVDAHPLPQHRILVGKKSLIHPLKDVTEYRAQWKRFKYSSSNG